jgi:hypothetical protein
MIKWAEALTEGLDANGLLNWLKIGDYGWAGT